MMQIKLREFANLPEAQVLRWLGTRLAVEVTDDAGEKKKSDTYALMLSWQGLGVHRAFDKLPYLNNELVRSDKFEEGIVYNDAEFALPIDNFLERVMPTMYDPHESDLVKRLLYIWQTKLNNIITVMSERSAISATAECVGELIEDPGIVEIKRKIVDCEITIDEGEVEFIDYMKNSPTLNYNTFALLARTGGVAYNQAFQTAVCRGSTFDLNNQIFPNPILDSYAEGIVNLTDSLTESRGAGKALISNGKALRDAEWFHRKTHLFMATTSSINHYHDCGTDMVIPIKITGRDIAKSLMGKYYVDEKGTLGLITKAVYKTIQTGDVVNIRSMAFCKNHDPSQPCRVCYGQMKTSVPFNVIMQKDANIGMYSGTTICNPIGQRMLSTKHFLKNTTTQSFVVNKRLGDDRVINSNGDDIFLNKDLCLPGTQLILDQSVVKELADIRNLDNLEDLGQDKLSYFDNVTFKFESIDEMMNEKVVEQKPVTTSVSSRSARMSTDLLEYIRINNFQRVDKKYISIDLAKWNFKSPLFTLPYMHEDLDVHRRKIESFLTLSNRNPVWKAEEITPVKFGETLTEFWNLINEKFKGNNIIHVETMLYSITAKDPENGSYALVNGNGSKYFASLGECIPNRGAGTMLIFERQQIALNDHKSFLMKDRQGSQLESFWSNGVS